MRRLPIFFLLDVSESMAGDSLRQLQQGLERLVRSLRTDPHALETVYLSMIAFAGKAKTLTPLIEVASHGIRGCARTFDGGNRQKRYQNHA